MLIEMHVQFIGHVQGVGFRYTAKKQALLLGLSGTVKNLADGSVELMAQGEKKQLLNLIDFLENEAFSGKITESKKEFTSPKQIFSSFSIISD